MFKKKYKKAKNSTKEVTFKPKWKQNSSWKKEKERKVTKGIEKDVNFKESNIR